MDKLKYIKSSKIFQLLPKNTLELLTGALKENHFKKGDVIIHEGEPGTCMYFIASGKVQIQIRTKEDVVLGEREFFGEMALISGAPRSADVLALTDVVLLSLEKQDFDSIVLAQPVASSLLTQVLANRLGAPADKLSQKSLGKYKISDELGRGDIGMVYRGYHMALEMPVAVKMLSHSYVYDTNNLRKFLAEAKLIAKISHKNIVKIYDIEQMYGTYFIIEEFVNGATLKAVLEKDKILPVVVAREIIVQAAEGLAYAHFNGVIHKNFKPNNVMFDEKGIVKVTGFGITRFEKAGQKNEAEITAVIPHYASPEQLEAKELDYRSDIYSFGAVCYEMLTGKPPFDGPDAFTVISKQLHDDFMPPKEINPQIPDDLNVLICRCLEKDRSKRLQNLSNLKEMLDIWFKGKVTAQELTHLEKSEDSSPEPVIKKISVGGQEFYKSNISVPYEKLGVNELQKFLTGKPGSFTKSEKETAEAVPRPVIKEEPAEAQEHYEFTINENAAQIPLESIGEKPLLLEKQRQELAVLYSILRQLAFGRHNGKINDVIKKALTLLVPGAQVDLFSAPENELLKKLEASGKNNILQETSDDKTQIRAYMINGKEKKKMFIVLKGKEEVFSHKDFVLENFINDLMLYNK
ncbi:MAG: hypothetical protein A2252_00845 [Elusimicrobia bacterium RIFOXYA2_FULL_39_19]|nr:MAG: hypothetical protein A2252_00845 [Elusimicrobia bacterium RIFOXYA2_FULL_39_19]